MLVTKIIENIKRYEHTRYLKRHLAYLGENVQFDNDIRIQNPSKIEINDCAKIYKGAFINARGTDDKIVSIKIGKNVKIHEYSYIDTYEGSIELEDFVGIGHHCIIGGHGGLKIGKYSMIAGLTYIVPANHKFENFNTPYMFQGESRLGITIGSNVWVGARSIILDGVTIGDNCIIAAGSVVTRSIESNCLAMGSPAKIHRKLF